MTRKSIDEQVEILKTTTERVGVSAETASSFLSSAGIFVLKDGVIYGKTGRRYDSKGVRAHRVKTSDKFISKKRK